jgi:hypothetical protein
MNLDSKLRDFFTFTSQKTIGGSIDKLSKQDVVKFFNAHRSKLQSVLQVVKTLKDFEKSSNKYSIVEGVLNIIQSSYVDTTWSYADFFSPSNGWKSMAEDLSFFPVGIFYPMLDKYPTMEIKLGPSNFVKIHTLPLGEVGSCKIYNATYIYAKFTSYTVSDLISYLVAEKFKELNSNLVHYNISFEGSSTVQTLVPDVFRSVKSEKSTYYVSYIKKCIDLNICRSILFYGPPGTGKTTLAQSVVDELGLKTLKLSFKDFRPLDVRFFIKNFNFDAILIDDFDQISETSSVLDFLEDIRSSVKVIIASANTLKNFHPAVIRPNRFDERILVDTLETSSIEVSLDNLAEKYADKVKHWPIAYINELVIRSKVYPIEDLDKHYDDLNKRVLEQIEKLK